MGKSARLEIRWPPELVERIRQAAAARHETVSEFVRRAAEEASTPDGAR